MMTAFSSHVAGGGRPVVLVAGERGPLVDDALAEVIGWGSQRAGLPAFNVGTYRVSDSSGIEGVATARTVPMMADLRVVVLRDVESGDSAFFETLLDYLVDPSPSTLLVLQAGSFPAAKKGEKAWGTRVQRAVDKVGVVVKLDAGSVAPEAFVAERARGLGKHIDTRDAELLVAVVGSDLARLAGEVDKVALYVGDAERIDADAIHAACSMLAEAVAWDLTAGLAARDREVALGAVHRLLADGDDPRRLLGLVAWQLRTVLQVAERVRAKQDDRGIQRDLRLRWNQLQAIRKGLERGGLPAAAPTMARLARAYRDMNSHRAGDRRVLESLVLDLCS